MKFFKRWNSLLSEEKNKLFNACDTAFITTEKVKPVGSFFFIILDLEESKILILFSKIKRKDAELRLT